jgi:hypothetical protein
VECAVELVVVPAHRVVWVIRDGIEIPGPRAEGLGVRVCGVDLVAEGAIVGRSINVLRESLAADKVVEGAVLHDDVDNILDLILQVLDGLG